MINVPTPSKEEVEKYLKVWNDNEEFVEQEKCLDMFFKEKMKDNTDLYEILVKVTLLNHFYGTNISNVYNVAKHIKELDIDQRLKVKDETLVDDIARVKYGDKEIRFYSFASKYCSFHYPEDYPLYDSYVEKVLAYFRDKDKFAIFLNKDLKDYSVFKRIIIEFSKFYKIDNYSLKQIDMYLWQFGKEYFKR